MWIAEIAFLSDKKKEVASAATKSDSQVNIDRAFEPLVVMIKDSSGFLNSVELHEAYKEFGGDRLTRRLIVPNLCECFVVELVVLKSPGLADIDSLRSIAAKCMRLVQDEDIDVTINKLCEVIRNEVKLITLDKDCCDTRVNRQECRETVRDTLMTLLGKLSPNPDRALPALLIGNWGDEKPSH